ncbi:hypothetical protein HMPREF0454_04209 [Hafnia alvei ATCC 51873]|uniref:Uncharacterized protein n=1 Tax=Hafnia alvei ATCC 51873 TaxID=1002364 RepID=G9YC76_HAFAL|nr:hypothetical protein HMPREF0454_04209 [Hafnia alvei ATCC 51873]
MAFFYISATSNYPALHRISFKQPHTLRHCDGDFVIKQMFYLNRFEMPHNSLPIKIYKKTNN